MKIIDKHVYFWGLEFSNFYPCKFTIDGITYNTSEKYFMYSKAIFFGDKEIAQAILNEDNPSKVKALGRKVKNYDDKKWSEVRYDYMYKAVKAKFTQDKKLNKFICQKIFDNKTFVEASPFDRIWGVGFGEDQAYKHKNEWGENLLGQILNKVREEIVSKE